MQNLGNSTLIEEMGVSSALIVGNDTILFVGTPPWFLQRQYLTVGRCQFPHDPQGHGGILTLRLSTCSKPIQPGKQCTRQDGIFGVFKIGGCSSLGFLLMPLVWHKVTGSARGYCASYGTVPPLTGAPLHWNSIILATIIISNLSNSFGKSQQIGRRFHEEVVVTSILRFSHLNPKLLFSCSSVIGWLLVKKSSCGVARGSRQVSSRASFLRPVLQQVGMVRFNLRNQFPHQSSW